jgi:hypothetical protein
MIDFERFDQWVAAHDHDKEAYELSKVVLEGLVLTHALIGEQAAIEAAESLVTSSLKAAYGTAEGFESQAHLNLGDPVSAVEELFDEVDFLNFKFAQQANGLRCYAMTGMLEGETPSHSFEEKRLALTELIEWGEMICGMLHVDRAPLPNFRSIVSAARGRFALDLDHPIEASDFVHLAALFRDGTPDQAKKTLQNQISAKQVAINDRRQILPEGALAFLKGAPGFPSIWMLQEPSEVEAEAVGTPVFVPVCGATSSTAEVPFLPSQRHADGYRIGVGSGAKIEADFWTALRALSAMPEPAFQPAGAPGAMRCKSDWMRVDRDLLENELNALQVAQGEGASRSLTDQMHRRLMAHPLITTHPIGHKDKGYRYRSEAGLELLLEKRVGEPWLYLLQRVAPTAINVASESVVGTKVGRLTTLNALPTFKNEPLTKFKLRKISDLDLVLGGLDL